MGRETKDSHISWIRDIPKDWSILRNKYCFTNAKVIAGIDSTNYDRLALTMNGVIKRSKEDNEGLQPHDFDTYQILKKDELVFKLIDLQNISTSRVGLCTFTEGIVSPAYIVLKSNGRVLPEYAEKFFLMMWHNQVFNYLGDAGVRSSLNATELLELPICVPPKKEQKQIADFLNKKGMDIENLIAAIQEEIKTLEDYKFSVIYESIVHGIEGKELIKTGSQYWAKIPKDWKLKDIKYLFKIVKRIAGKEGYDVISITQQGLKKKDIESFEGQMADDYSGYQFVFPGEYAMNHMDLLTGWVDLSSMFGVTSPDYRVFKLLNEKENDKKFFLYVMQTCYKCRIFYSLGQGVSNMGRWRLQAPAFNNFKIPVPPYDEQIRIREYLDDFSQKIDAFVRDRKKQIDILQDYKKSLIYEYVTGKREVPANE